MGKQFAVWLMIGWIVCALLAVVVGSRAVQNALGVDIPTGSVLAMSYDALPLLLFLAWPVAALAAVGDHLALTLFGAVLVLFQASMVVPRVVRAPTPEWVSSAELVRVAVANVFVDNETPDAAARQLIETCADILVIVESTARFMDVFDECGGDVAYPHRVLDPDTTSDYAVAVVTRRELGPRTHFLEVGALRLVVADVVLDDDHLLVVALNPMATVDPDGNAIWEEQIDLLAKVLPTFTGPVLVAGDLNSTRFRPRFQRIMDLGFQDAIDALGKGISPSFKLTARRRGAVVRLDHALTNDEVQGLSMANLEACGSDHYPFVMELAVRRPPR